MKLRLFLDYLNAATDMIFIKVFVCYRNVNVFCGENFFLSKTSKIIEIRAIFVKLQVIENPGFYRLFEDFLKKKK